MKFKDMIEGKRHESDDSKNIYEKREGLLYCTTTSDWSVHGADEIIKWNFEEYQEHYTFDEAYKDCKNTGQSYRGVNEGEFIQVDTQYMTRHKFNNKVYISEKHEESDDIGVIALDVMWVKID